MTEHRSPYVWPKPRTGIHLIVWTTLWAKLAQTRWARHYRLSREIGQQRRFIRHLRAWGNRWLSDDARNALVQRMAAEEQRELVTLIGQREALWRTK